MSDYMSNEKTKKYLDYLVEQLKLTLFENRYAELTKMDRNLDTPYRHPSPTYKDYCRFRQVIKDRVDVPWPPGLLTTLESDLSDIPDESPSVINKLPKEFAGDSVLIDPSDEAFLIGIIDTALIKIKSVSVEKRAEMFSLLIKKLKIKKPHLCEEAMARIKQEIEIPETQEET
jgi:hypothetical protein